MSVQGHRPTFSIQDVFQPKGWGKSKAQREAVEALRRDIHGNSLHALPWDHPDADPLGDLQRFMAAGPVQYDRSAWHFDLVQQARRSAEAELIERINARLRGR